jgi:hypothetical protein
MAIYQPATDQKLGKVVVWGRKASVPRLLRECIPSRAPLGTHDSEKDWPSRADFYIVRSLSAEVEWEAAQLHAMPVCLPAATDWLTGRIYERCKEGGQTWICLRRKS